MLALTLLLGLIVWVIITLAAIFIGTKLGKSLYPDNPKAGLYGALLGFMLTMGGFIVYWAVEYAYIQTKVNQLCESEGGVTVYVTPAEYRTQIGEEEWEALIRFTNSEINNKNSKTKLIRQESRIYSYAEGRYRNGNIENAKIALFSSYRKKGNNINETSQILAEKNNGRIVVRQIYYSHHTNAIANNLGGLKFWMNSIQDCSDKYNHEFYRVAKQYSNTY